MTCSAVFGPLHVSIKEQPLLLDRSLNGSQCLSISANHRSYAPAGAWSHLALLTAHLARVTEVGSLAALLSVCALTFRIDLNT